MVIRWSSARITVRAPVLAALAFAPIVLTQPGCMPAAGPEQQDDEFAPQIQQGWVEGRERAALSAYPFNDWVGQPAVAPSPATRAIEALLEDYGRSLEAGDVVRIREEIFGGVMAVERGQGLEDWLRGVRQLRVSLRPRITAVYDGHARGVAWQTSSYREREGVRWWLDIERVLLEFERRNGRWYIKRLASQRRRTRLLGWPEFRFYQR